MRSTLTESKQVLEESVADAQVLSQLKESEVIPLFHEKQRLQTELDSLQGHCTWLEQELQAKSTDYTRVRQESRDRAIQLQLQLDQTTDDKAAAEARVDALQKMERALQTKLDELSHGILQTRQELATVKETTEQEIHEERRIVTLQKDQLDRWQHRYNDVVRENEGLKQAASEAIQCHEQELERERDQLEQKYVTILKEQASDYEGKLQAQEEAPRRLALPAKAPGVTIDPDEDGPLSLTDLYTRLEETKDALREEISRRQLAEARFESVRKDIEEKAPIMNRQRREYDLAMDRLQEYHQRLESALAERDDAREDSREVRQEVAKLQQRLADKQSESQELAKQVQALLVSRAGGQVAADIPASIEEMQNQNQRLLSEHRRLTKNVAELEDKLQTDTLKTKLEKSESELSSLREDRKHQEVQVVQIVQQRDMYRALLKLESGSVGSEGEQVTALELTKQQSERAKKLELKNRDLEDDLAASRSKIVGLERDSEVGRERLARYELHQAEMRNSHSKLQDALSRARAEAAHRQNDSKYYSDKCERLEQSIQSLQNESQGLKNSKGKLDRINAGLEERLSSAGARAARLEGEKQQAEMKLRLAQTQLHTAKAAETRILEETNQLRSELARQGAVVASVRRIEESLSARNEEEKEKLGREIKRISQLHASDQSKHSLEVENMNVRTQELEVRIQDIETKKEKAQGEMIEAKTALLESQAEKQKYAAKASNFESQLRSAKKKLGESDDIEDVEATMQNKIISLSSELESAKTDISLWKKRASTYEKMAKTSEVALSESNKAIEDFKAAHIKETNELKSSIESMKKEIASKQEMVVELTKDLAGQRGEREQLEENLQRQISSLETQIANDKASVESAKATAAALKFDVGNVQKDVAVAQNNYERELALHSQARTSLRVSLEEAQKEAGLRLAAEQKLDGVKSELSQQLSLWEEEKASIQDTSNILDQSLAGAREQIVLLHTQVEKLGDVVEKAQASRVAAGGDDSDALGDQKDFSELREVVKFLRLENDLIQSQLDSAKRKADRERASTSVVRRSLDETRAELKMMQDQEDSGVSNKEAANDLTEKLRVGEDQLNLLRDSNKLLREDTEKLHTALSSAQEQLSALKTSSESAGQMKKDMDGKISALEAERLSLKKEIDSWKDRVTSLVSKFNQIDPEEHKKALNESEDLKKEIASLNAWKKTTAEESARIRTIAANLNKRLKELRAVNESQSKEISKLTTEKASMATASSEGSSVTAKERDELKEKIKKLEKEFNAAKTELQGANDRNDRLRETLRKFQKTIQELRGKEKALTAQLSAAEQQATSVVPAAVMLSTAEQQAASTVPTAAGESHVTAVKSGEDPKAALASSSIDQGLQPKTLEIKVASTEQGPKVPDGGFKFGPSAPMQTQHVEPQAVKQAIKVAPVQKKPAATKESTAMNPGASPFAPVAKPTAASLAPAVEIKKTPSTNEPTKSPTQTSLGAEIDLRPAAETDSMKVPRRMSGEKAEMSMKEKILEKKRLLAEAKARKRKMEAELDAKKPQLHTGEEPTSKRTKPNEDSEPKKREIEETAVVAENKSEETATPTKEKASVPTPEPGTPSAKEASEAGESVPVEAPIVAEDKNAETVGDDEAKNESDDAVVEDVADEDGQENAMAEEEEEGVDEEEDDVVLVDDEDDPAADEVEEEEEEAQDNEPEELKKPAMAFGTSSAPFGGAVSGQTTIFGAPVSFGQGFGTPSSFGNMAGTTSTTQPSGFGNSFLSMKPPGNPTTPPTFSFGGSAIKLPIPSQQNVPAPSPFGSFGSGTASFGSFGRGGGGSVPLFGAPAPAPATEEQAEPIDEGEDEMEAES